jgi:anti-sigma B factor antagonist
MTSGVLSAASFGQPPFSVSRRRCPQGHEVVRVAGELDVDTSGELRDELQKALAGRRYAVLVDLQDTTFIDAVGLGTLLRAAWRARGAGGVMATICPDPNVRRVFELSDAATSVGLYATGGEALEAIAAH